MAVNAMLALALCSALGSAMASSKNPFEGHSFYVNPIHAKNYASVKNVSGKVKDNLERMQKVAIANWIDKKSKIHGNDTGSLEGLLKDAASKEKPELVFLMLYNLPNRDCSAKASDGEICCITSKKHNNCDYYHQKGECEDGVKEYKTEFIDPIVELLSKYDKKLPMVVVLEPDSLANLATNTGNKHCGKTTQAAYKNGITYALKQLKAKAPSVSIYLDGANGGWMGWTSNLDKFMLAIKKLDLPIESIRGFVTNVANYQPLGVQCPWCPDQGYRNGFCLAGHHSMDPCCSDPLSMLTEYNFGNNELNYAAGLAMAAKKFLDWEVHMVIDTGRNGVANTRSNYRIWCNPRKAGAGVPSTAKTHNASLTDAYFWMKTPGESDGCTELLPGGEECKRYDSMCGSEESIGYEDEEPSAPEAGQWFEYQVKKLAANAHFDPPKNPKRKEDPCGTAAAEKKEKKKAKKLKGHKTSIKGEKGCAAVFEQCGAGKGQEWAGPKCCEAGCTCKPNGLYDDQCKPPKGLWKCIVTADMVDEEKDGKGKGDDDDEDDEDEDEAEDEDEDEDEEEDKDEDEDEDDDDDKLESKFSTRVRAPLAGQSLFWFPVLLACLGAVVAMTAAVKLRAWGRARAWARPECPTACGEQARELYDHLDPHASAGAEDAP